MRYGHSDAPEALFFYSNHKHVNQLQTLIIEINVKGVHFSTTIIFVAGIISHILDNEDIEFLAPLTSCCCYFLENNNKVFWYPYRDKIRQSNHLYPQNQVNSNLNNPEGLHPPSTLLIFRPQASFASGATCGAPLQIQAINKFKQLKKPSIS